MCKSRILLELTMILLVVSGCSKPQSDAEKKFYNENLLCPPPAVEEFQPWGESGTAHSCKLKNGPFVAWEGGRIQIRGQYLNGKESGTWYWYDSAGNTERKIDYAVLPPP